MYLQLDGKGELYRQLLRALKRAILEGRLEPGARLPATRTLGAELGVSRNTVLAAYDVLQAETLVATRGGGGTYVADVALPKAQARPAGPAVAAQSRYAAWLRALRLRRGDWPGREAVEGRFDRAIQAAVSIDGACPIAA